MDELERLTGTRPTVGRPATNRWRIEMRNPRVFAYADFKISPGGRCVQAGTALHIDGERVENANGYAHFARIFTADDPWSEVQEKVIEPIPIGDPIEPINVEDAPPAVRAGYTDLVRGLPAGTEVTVGMGNGYYWSVTAQVGVATIRLNFYNGKPVKLSSRTPIQIMVAGVDRTSEIQGRLDRALAMMTGQPGEQISATPTIGASPAARSNAVETRRATVIRN